MDEPTVELYMTAPAYTIGPEQPLSAAHALMRAHAIRHLPVLEDGALVGLLSLGDLHLLETLDGVDPDAARRIVSDHLVAGTPVERRRLRR